jgi:hypothetical protein
VLLALPLSLAVMPTVYDPLGAEAGVVTTMVSDTDDPGPTGSVEPAAGFGVHPEGTLATRSKVDVPHAELLRLVNDTVTLAAPPGVTVLGAADSVIVGAVRVHDDGA